MNWLVYALHGNDPRYTEGMIRNVGSVHRVYGPGWTFLIYHDTTVPGSVIGKLRSTGSVVLRRIDQTTRPHWANYEGRFWRLLAIEDPLVLKNHGAVVAFRDADSRISPREVQATMEFYVSGKLVHIMRDHPNHSTRPMLGGMWDYRVSPNPKRLSWIVDEAEKWLETQARERAERPWSNDFFLGRFIYPRLKKVVLEHDTFAGRPFPGLTGPGPFVGEIILVDREGNEAPNLCDREKRDLTLAIHYENGRLKK